MKNQSLSGKFSFYPNVRVRVLAHLIAWVCVFSLFILTSKTLFTADATAPPVLLYSTLVLFVIFCNHYFLSLITIPSLSDKRKWGWVPFQLLAVYIFSALITVLPLEYLAYKYPEYPSFRFQSDRRFIHSFGDVFSYKTLVWVLTVIMFYNVALFLVKFAKSSYESNMNNILLRSENTSLELNFLRAQIQPHFLFNTLNNIYGLVLDNRRASDSILKLSDLLRFSLYESNAAHITLKRETEFLSDYINLEQMRHKERVNILYTFNEIEDDQKMIAPLLLVNFIENAFKHGVNASIGKAWVKINLKATEDTVTFTVENNKPDDDYPPANHKLEGLGLVNTRRRLDLIYPGKHNLLINETDTIFFVQLNIYLS